MMFLTFDQWMDISGLGGILLYLWAHWWRLEHIDVTSRLNLGLRVLGLGMILTPLFFRWYLSATLILVLSLLMAAFSASMHLQERKERDKP